MEALVADCTPVLVFMLILTSGAKGLMSVKLKSCPLGKLTENHSDTKLADRKFSLLMSQNFA